MSKVLIKELDCTMKTVSDHIDNRKWLNKFNISYTVNGKGSMVTTHTCKKCGLRVKYNYQRGMIKVFDRVRYGVEDNVLYTKHEPWHYGECE